MTSELHKRSITPAGRDPRGWELGGAARRRHSVAVGLGVIVSLALVGIAVVAAVFVMHTLGASWFGRGGPGQSRSGVAAGQQSLDVQRRLVGEKRDAVAAYAARLTEFKAVTSRPPGAAGINLDAAEARRRDDVLTGLVLDCIDAVDHYNIAAQTRSSTQLRSAGLPDHFVWAVDCAVG